MLEDGYGSLLRGYEGEHRRRGTQIVHLIALPLMASSVLVAFISFRWALALIAVGFALQLLSHTFIEGNDQCLRSWKRVLLAGLWSVDRWRSILRALSSKRR